MSLIIIEITDHPYNGLTPFRGEAAYVNAPFACKDDIKDLPERRWDKSRKRWVIPAADVESAKMRLEFRGHSVQVIDLRDARQERGRAERPRRADTWADHMFRAVPQRLHAPVHTALTKVLHPDAGGDTASMQTLNGARDRFPARAS